MRHGTARARGPRRVGSVVPSVRDGQRQPMVTPVTGTDGGSLARPRHATIGPCAHDLVSGTTHRLPSGRRCPPRPPTDRAPRPRARSSGGSSGRIGWRSRRPIPGEPLATPDGSRGGARRASRHRPRDRRSPGRLARPARAAADDRGRHEAGAPGGCHDDLDRPRRPARDDRLGGHPRRRGRPAAGLSARRSLGRGGPADRPGAGPAGRPRGRRLRGSSATRASRWPAT